jgi:hypothetical protein
MMLASFRTRAAISAAGAALTRRATVPRSADSQVLRRTSRLADMRTPAIRG